MPVGPVTERTAAPRDVDPGDAQLTVDVLGALQAHVGARRVALGGRRQRVVLAGLLVEAGRVVSVDRLLDRVWRGEPPDSAAGTLHTYLSRLRRELGGAGRLLRRDSGGYLLDVQTHQLDSYRFRLLAASGRQHLAQGKVSEAANAFRTALGLWRGPAYADLADEPFLAAESTQLDESRLDAVESYAAAELALGRADEAVDPLRAALGISPLRERLTELLMVALYRGGRQAEALAAYTRCQRALAEELGVDPGPDLRQAFAAILDQRVEAAQPVGGASPRACNLPPRNPGFSGREELLAALDAALRRPTGPALAGTVALHGLGGVGKSQVALEYAHRRAEHLPTVWWVDADDPVTITAALTELAGRRRIADIADQAESLAALRDDLRTRTDWLIVFDNAHPDTIEPFLPPAGHGEVLITSNNPAWGRLGRPLAVSAFRREESVAFLMRRTSAFQTDSAEALAELTGDLPLALEQAAAYVEQTHLPVTEYVDLYARRLDRLFSRGSAAGYAGRLDTAWQLAFERVCAAPEATELLLTCGFLGAEAIPLDLLRPLMAPGGDSDDTQLRLSDAVAHLLRYSLVDRDESGLRMHRIVQSAARARVPAADLPARITSVVSLLVRAGGDLPVDRLAWSSWERLIPHVLTGDGHAATAGLTPPGLVGLLRRTAAYLETRAAYPAARRMLESAIDHAQRAGDTPVLVAELLTDLGKVLDEMGLVTEARSRHERALAVLEAEVGPEAIQVGRALARLGRAQHCGGDGAAARPSLERALTILRRQGGEPSEIAAVLTDLGYSQWAAGDLRNAQASFGDALAAFQAAGRHRAPECALVVSGLGMVRQDSGDIAGALDAQQQAIATLQATLDAEHPWVGETLDKLGYAQRLAGELTASAASHSRAVDILTGAYGAGDPRAAMALTNLGLTRFDAGDLEQARRDQEQALQILEAAYDEQHPNTMIVRRRLAQVSYRQGDTRQARHLLETALRHTARTLGEQHPDVAAMRDELTQMPPTFPDDP